ncbi:hypothetical protein F5X96DRAFT_616214 [Biscogniauxia mediterranea]|nr:hypothetical protein F5X96DRAFT_616214 [Biscogniauxia mediterranea]
MQIIAALTLALAATSYARSTPLRIRQDEDRTYAPCGGFVVDPQTCEEGFQCIRDPRRGDVTDLPGICVPVAWTQCGGIANLECLPGTGPSQCYDWPNDDCDPNNGGADCIGICLYPL